MLEMKPDNTQAEQELRFVCRESVSGMEPDPAWHAPSSSTWRKARKFRMHALNLLAKEQEVHNTHMSEAFHRGWRAGVLSVKLECACVEAPPDSFTDYEHMAFMMGAVDGWCSALWYLKSGTKSHHLK